MVTVVRLGLLAAAGVVAGALAAAFVIVAGGGVFWLYLFGDDPWPAWAEKALVAVGYGTGALVAIVVPLVLARSGVLPARHRGPA